MITKTNLVRDYKINVALRQCAKCGLSPIQAGLDKVTGKWFRFECPECGVNWRGPSAALPHWWQSRQAAAENWNELNEPKT